MARIDWNKVAEDYQNSVLNKERLHQYAQKAAQALRSRNVFFDGFTDAAYEAAKEAAWQAWQRQGFFHRLFHRPPRRRRPALGWTTGISVTGCWKPARKSSTQGAGLSIGM